MSDITHVVSWGLGTIAGFAVLVALVFVLLRDITQQRHTILRNYPVIGHLRYFFENLGEYFRQYFFAGDRDEMPFNRATRGWVYRLAKDEGGIIGFGSTYDLRQPGSILFVNAPFPVLEADQLPTPPLLIGEGHCRYPLAGRSVVNVSGMSFGAISAPAVRALSMGAKEAGCWMDTGEGGLSPYHLEGGCDVIMQIGTAKYGENAYLVEYDPVARCQAGQGRGAACNEGDRGDRAHPRHSAARRLDQPEPPSRHR